MTISKILKKFPDFYGTQTFVIMLARALHPTLSQINKKTVPPSFLKTHFNNPITSTIPKWWTFKLLSWIQTLHQSVWNHEMLYDDTSSKAEQLVIMYECNKTTFVKNQKYEHGGQLKSKTDILFFALRQMKFGRVKDHRYTYKLSSFSLIKLLNMAMVQNSVIMLGQMLNHCAQNSVILCNVKSLTYYYYT
jgi:hypothetical protein